VLPALIRKFHDAKESNAPFVEMWGTGTPMREFLHSDDMADACVYLMQKYSGQKIVNIGTGVDLTINDLALLIKKIVGYTGDIKHDLSKPDGTPRKLMDVSFLHSLGWKHKIDLETGIKMVYEDFSKKEGVKVW
jgi:GDP-L-fucose synthase